MRRMRTRGLAAGILRFIAFALFFAILYGVFNIFILDLFGSVGLDATSQKVGTLQGYMQEAWIALPAIVMFAIAASLITRSVFESRGGVS